MLPETMLSTHQPSVEITEITKIAKRKLKRKILLFVLAVWLHDVRFLKALQVIVIKAVDDFYRSVVRSGTEKRMHIFFMNIYTQNTNSTILKFSECPLSLLRQTKPVSTLSYQLQLFTIPFNKKKGKLTGKMEFFIHQISCVLFVKLFCGFLNCFPFAAFFPTFSAIYFESG